MQTHAHRNDEAWCERNGCSLSETVWCEKHHAVSQYSQEVHAKRCARCNRKGADVTSADIDHYWRTRIRLTLPLGTQMIAIKGTLRGRDFGYCKGGSFVDQIGDGCVVYYIEENEDETHCLVFPGDYIQGNSSRENEPIDLWMMSSNLMVCRHAPSVVHARVRSARRSRALHTLRFNAGPAAPQCR